MATDRMDANRMNPEEAYHFDEAVSRRGSNCVKWDAQPPVPVQGDVLPLWVADMDFPAAPCIREALQRRIEHGIFGYVQVPASYDACVSDWFARRHGWSPSPDWMLHTTGVVPGISAVLKALCAPGDKVVVLTPVYNCFFSSIRNMECSVLACPLKETAGPGYVMDFEALERCCADPKARVLLLCNPHNPAGRVWTRAELEQAAAIARRNGCIVVSDEIHCEIVMPGHHYTPMGSVDQGNCITLCSPSKSFNIAGLQMASIITDNAIWRQRIERAINIHEVCDINPFGPVAGEAAYSEEGARWLEALNHYLATNDRVLRERFAAEAPDFPVFPLEGTYLVWVDCRKLQLRSDQIEAQLLQHEAVWVNAGQMYGTEGFIRINIATSRALLSEGLDRILKGLNRLLRA